MGRIRIAYALILIVIILYATSITSINVLYLSLDQPTDCNARSIFFIPDYTTWLIAYSIIVLMLSLVLTYLLYMAYETEIVWVFAVTLINIVCYVACMTIGIIIVSHDILNCILEGDTISTMIAIDVFSFLVVLGLLYMSSPK